MNEPVLHGVHPIYSHKGYVIALVHIYEGFEEECRQRCLAVCKATSIFDGEPFEDQTRSTRFVPPKARSVPDTIGTYQLYSHRGYAVTTVYILRGMEEECRQRSLVAAKALARFDNEPVEDMANACPRMLPGPRSAFG